MNDDLYVFYLGCFQLAYGREERARERESENNETVAMGARRRWMRRSGGVLGMLLSVCCLLFSVFSLRNAFIDRFRSARVVRKIN